MSVLKIRNATGLALFYDRASKAVTSTQFTQVALTLQNADGNILENRVFDTLYEPQDSQTENE